MEEFDKPPPYSTTPYSPTAPVHTQPMGYQGTNYSGAPTDPYTGNVSQPPGPGAYGAQPGGAYGAQPGGPYNAANAEKPGGPYNANIAQPGGPYNANVSLPPGTYNVTVAPPAGYQVIPPSAMPNYGGIVHVKPVPQRVSEIVVVGTCPACRVGVLEEDFTCLGVCLAVFFFPLGILCCLAMRHQRCPNCGAIYG